MSEHDAILQTILTSPADDAPPLIFSDWLEERGDPARAEVVRVQCQLARWVPGLAERTALQQHERALIAEYAEGWLGPLHGLGEEIHFEHGLAHLTLKARTFVGRAFAGAAEWLGRG